MGRVQRQREAAAEAAHRETSEEVAAGRTGRARRLLSWSPLWLAVATTLIVAGSPDRAETIPPHEVIDLWPRPVALSSPSDPNAEPDLPVERASWTTALDLSADPNRGHGRSAFDPAAMEATCARIGGKLGSVSVDDCLRRNLVASGGASVRGTPILMREFGALPDRESLGRVLLIGGIHGDEYSAVSIVFRWMETLDRHHSGLFHWRVVPLLNPDGLLREESQRTNANGVDLNRNFPTPDWDVDAIEYWERKAYRNPRRYPGPEALSEPESQWLVDEIERFRPSAIVTVHAPLEVVDYDGPPDPPHRLGSLYLEQMGTYPGSLGRYAGVHQGLPVVTIELPSAGIMPSVEEQRKIWTDLVSYLKVTLPKHNAGRQTTSVATGG